MTLSAPLNSVQIVTQSPEETTELAELFADHTREGLTYLLDGHLGAGKSHFARSFIQHLMRQVGDVREVPSPTFNLVQLYQVNMLEIWHTDLYRLSFFEELVELNIDTALDRAICLIEWPDRLGPITPPSSVMIKMQMLDAENERRIDISNFSALPDALVKELAQRATV